MKGIIISIFCLLQFISNSSGQTFEEVIGCKNISNYQNYLIENPETPFIILITDSLRQMWDRRNIENYHSHCHCNCVEVIVNSENEILIEGNLIEINNLAESFDYLYNNPDFRQDLPEIETLITKDFGPINRSKGIIDIITSNIDSELYTKIIKEAKNVFLRKRDWYADQIYSEDYKNLSSEIRNQIDEIIPFKIRFERYIPGKLRLPKPPEPKNIKLEGIPNIEEEPDEIE